ncbi:hypothetical protein TRFO_09186 [Tritrichomonas foetus]|uniref:Uncharacterized protein n=1 Tax=Tritrichomonas foetus TaxID=1144522 RepID=A0A1J4JL61_9EUKA|nr:hypothetical protein TRFO_09186 [Tritrichomonas foetus]|eukprot:OHS98004.1 hypothetical protein TRFO_09186 [Tritrichomonas foetus]
MQNISINLLNNYIKLSHPFSLSHQFKGMPFQLDGSLDFTTDGNSLSGQLCHSFSFDSLISAKYSVAASKKATKVEFSGNLNQIIDFAFSSDGKESSNEISYNFPFGAVGVKTVNSPDNESNSNENTATPKSSINSIGLGLILHDHNKNHQFGMIYDVYKRSADLRIASNFLQKLMELGKLNLFHSNVMLASCTATCFNQKDPILSGASISVLTSNPNSTGLQFTITHDKTFAAKVTTSVNEATAVSACLKVEGNSDLSFGVKVDIKP